MSTTVFQNSATQPPFFLSVFALQKLSDQKSTKRGEMGFKRSNPTFYSIYF